MAEKGLGRVEWLWVSRENQCLAYVLFQYTKFAVKLTLMRGVFLDANEINIFFNDIPPLVSLHCKLLTVQTWECEYCLFLLVWRVLLPTDSRSEVEGGSEAVEFPCEKLRKLVYMLRGGNHEFYRLNQDMQDETQLFFSRESIINKHKKKTENVTKCCHVFLKWYLLGFK